MPIAVECACVCLCLYIRMCWRWLTCGSVECLIMRTDLYCRIAFKYYYDFIRFHCFVLKWFYGKNGVRKESTFDINICNFCCLCWTRVGWIFFLFFSFLFSSTLNIPLPNRMNLSVFVSFSLFISLAFYFFSYFDFTSQFVCVQFDSGSSFAI